MFSLILHILLSSFFGLIIKHCQVRECNLITVGGTNYIVAASAAALSVIHNGSFEFNNATCILGTSNGAAYILSYFLLLSSVRTSGLSITWSIIRLSVLVPVLFSIFYWHEQPNNYQIAGIVFVCLSLPLLSIKPNTSGKIGNTSRASLIILALFLTTGGSYLSAKAFGELSPDSERQMYLLFLFGTTAVISVFALIIHKSPLKARDIFYGIMLGLCNISAGHFLLVAIRKLPGMVVFPVSGSMGIVVTTLAGLILWKERLGKITLIGTFAAVIAVVLINMK